MKKLTTILVTALILSYAGAPVEAESVKRNTLPNGLTIITKPSTANNIVSIAVSLKMGSLYETDSQAGLSTLMQDTILKGTESRSSEQIALELESMGTRLSTAANREYGNLVMQSTVESVYPSLDILFDLLMNAVFPEEYVDLQKNLQKRSILTRNDQPIYRAVDLMVEAHYGDHPFHKSRLGTEETIDSFTREDIIAMYKEIYVPNNMVITAIGNFDEKRLVKAVSDALGGLARDDDPEAVAGSRKDYTEPSVKIEKRNIAASWFALGWPSPTMTDPDHYAMEVLNGITGGSMNSRLFVAIREERGLAYQVSSFYNGRNESGIFVAYIGTKPESYEEARDVLISEVHKMTEEKADDEEITNAKNFLKGMNIMGQESNASQATKYGQYEILGAGYEYVDKFGAGIDAVSAEDIITVGKKYLTGPYSQGCVLAE